MRVDHQQIQGLVDRIESNLAEEVNVLGLADAFHMSPWHFQRTFKSLVGDTLGGYIRGRRMTRAASLLLESEQSIIDIALSVGFGSHEAFTRSFKSYFQQSPKAFRKNRPAIMLEEKPLLTSELYEHLAKGMQQDPVIAQLPPRYIAGFAANIPSPFVSKQDYCDILYTPWTTLLKRENELEARATGSYCGLMVSPSENFTEDMLSYIAGAVVESLDAVPQDMMTFSFPAQQVAMFEVFAGTENNLAKTIDYIYGYWLPNSQYTRGPGHDYEWFEDVVSFEDPALRSQYILPVQLRG
jgi:AraC family transcriptional regulator